MMRNRFSVLVTVAALLLWAGAAVAQSQNVQITQGPKVEHADATSAVVAWSTNVNAGTTLKYGTDPNNLNQTAQAPWGGLTHRVTLKNLQPNTTYYFQVVSGQAQGTGTSAMSSVSQLKTTAGSGAQSAAATPPPPPPPAQSAAATPPPPPPPPPASPAAAAAAAQNVQVVGGPIPQKVRETTAALWWETTAPEQQIVKYGTDPSKLTQTAQDPGPTQSHKVELTGLQPGTTYHVAITDTKGQVRTTSTFATMPPGWANNKTLDITQGPVIEYISDREAIVAWSTDQQSSSIVRYGTDPNNLSQSAEAAWGAGGANTHRVTLKNLQPNTKYYFKIESAQAKGTSTQAASQVYPFQTVANASAALKIAKQ